MSHHRLGPLAMAARGGLVRRPRRRLLDNGRTLGPHRGFASSSSSSSSSPPEPPRWTNHWRGLGLTYTIERGWGIGARVCGGWPEFIDAYEGGAFARRTRDDDRSRMFVLTRMPRATAIDLLEFRDGAAQALTHVYDVLYGRDDRSATDSTETMMATTYPELPVDRVARLRALGADDDVLLTLSRKIQNQTQALTVAGREPRGTRLVLERLDVGDVGLAAVEYHTTRLALDEAAARGYHEDEWLRIDVAYEVTEHVRILTTGHATIDDLESFETAFTWTFESCVSTPELIDWRLVASSPMQQTRCRVSRPWREGKQQQPPAPKH